MLQLDRLLSWRGPLRLAVGVPKQLGVGGLTVDEIGGATRERDPRAARARRRFTALVSDDSANFDLAEASLLIAAEDRPDTDVVGTMKRLDELGTHVRRQIDHAHLSRPSMHADELAIGALHEVLFGKVGLRGANPDEYGRPESSFLDVVLERGRGLPIILSIIYCAVARRAGLEAVGIGLPGHFIAEFRGAEMNVLVDPFDRGRRLTIEEAGAIVARVTGRERFELGPQHLQAVPARRTIVRVLENLKMAYVRDRAYLQALEVVERLLIVSPTPEHVRDRGLLLRQLPMADGVNLSAAWFDLNLYARLMTSAPDAAAIERLANDIWRDLGRSN
jgi:regulator of sirC expression with transglutaminase-like and TPR domain